MVVRVESEFTFTTPSNVVMCMLVPPTPVVVGRDVVVLREESLKPLNQPNPEVHRTCSETTGNQPNLPHILHTHFFFYFFGKLAITLETRTMYSALQ